MFSLRIFSLKLDIDFPMLQYQNWNTLTNLEVVQDGHQEFYQTTLIVNHLHYKKQHFSSSQQ